MARQAIPFCIEESPMPTIASRPLIIDRFSPGWVRRARRVLRDELKIDITRMRQEEWVAVLCVALDHWNDVNFADRVMRAAMRVIEKRYESY
jgi:hypothetical protein